MPSGIDTFVRGILRWAPEDLDYTLYGASSDLQQRPVGQPVSLELGGRPVRFTPLVWMDASAVRGRIPLIVRYMWALRRRIARGELRTFDILDFHRIEPSALFGADRRPRNVLLHQDMSVLRTSEADIMWRHAPWLYEAIERRLLRRLDRIYAVRQSAVDRYRRLYPELAARFAFLPTWVDDSVFRPEPSAAARAELRHTLLGGLGIGESRRVLTSVGRFDHQKDPLLLLESFRLLCQRGHDLHLVMIGDGQMRGRLASAVGAAQLQERVSLLGVRSPVEIARWLQASDVFVLSSAYEGMPIAVLEALASGVPVVSTDVGEVRLVVKPGLTGQISAARTPEAYAAAVEAALPVLERMRGRPCAEAVRVYSPQRVLGAMYENHRQQALRRR